MKKIFLFSITIAIIASGIFLGIIFHSSQSISVKATHSSQTEKQIPNIGLPQRLEIPQLRVSAPIEPVGLDSEKKMDVPKNVFGVGWYDLGPRPGQQGSAVLDGHYDTVTGAPSVFYNLKNLQKGDSLFVTDSQGNRLAFTVTLVTSYPYNQLPLQDIFTKNDKTRLNLITCGGTWDKLTRNYSERTVVYAER